MVCSSAVHYKDIVSYVEKFGSMPRNNNSAGDTIVYVEPIKKPVDHLPYLDELANELRLAFPTAKLHELNSKEIAALSYPLDNEEDDAVWLPVYPALAIGAIKARITGAYRIWVLAQFLAASNEGRVEKETLRKFCNSIGLYGHKRRRWTQDAIEAGLFPQETSEHYYYLSADKFAKSLAVSGRMDQVEILSSSFFSDQWRSLVYSAFILAAGLNQKVISQVKKAQLTGISVRTIQTFEAQISKRSNFIEYNLGRPAHPGDVSNLKHQGLYGFIQNTTLYQRIPNQLFVDFDQIRLSMKYSVTTRKQRTIDETLCTPSPTCGEDTTLVLSSLQRRMIMRRRWRSPVEQSRKMFFTSHKLAEKSARKEGFKSPSELDIPFAYLSESSWKRANKWELISA